MIGGSGIAAALSYLYSPWLVLERIGTQAFNEAVVLLERAAERHHIIGCMRVLGRDKCFKFSSTLRRFPPLFAPLPAAISAALLSIRVNVK